MSDFKELKDKYLEKLQEEPDVLVKLIADNDKTEPGRKTLRLLFDPKDEKEIAVAETIFSLYCDFASLVDRLSYDEVKEIQLKDNFGFNYYVEILKKLRSGNKPEEIDYKAVTPDYVGKVMYDYLVGMAADPEGAMEYMAKKARYNLEDIIDAERFRLDLETAGNILGKYNNASKSIEEVTLEDIEFGKKFALAFHNACEDGKLKEKENIKKRTL